MRLQGATNSGGTRTEKQMFLTHEEKVAALQKKYGQMEVSPHAPPSVPKTAEEFQALSMHIWESGQKQPIVLDAQERIIDGRKRLRICLKIGVEPQFVTQQDGDEQPDDAPAEEGLQSHDSQFGSLLTLLREHGGSWGYGDVRGHLCKALGGMPAASTMLTDARAAGIVTFPKPPVCDSTVALVGPNLANTDPEKSDSEEATQGCESKGVAPGGDTAPHSGADACADA